MTPLTLRRLRQVHQYLGMFFAPAILFFAVSGALQTFSLHENHGGGPYKPPAWIVTMASLHKDQALPHPPPARPAHPAGRADHAAKPADLQPPKAPEPAPRSPLPLKIFVLCLAVGLMASTGLGVVIGLQHAAYRPGSIIALALGVLLPIALIWV
jgi:hypothetical protein